MMRPPFAYEIIRILNSNIQFARISQFTVLRFDRITEEEISPSGRRFPGKSVSNNRRHFFCGNTVYSPVDAVALKGGQYGIAVIGTADQGRANSRSVKRGKEIPIHGGILYHSLLSVQLEPDLAAGKTACSVNGELRVLSVDPIPAAKLFPGNLTNAGIVLRRYGIGVGAAVHDMAHHDLLENCEANSIKSNHCSLNGGQWLLLLRQHRIIRQGSSVWAFHYLY